MSFTGLLFQAQYTLIHTALLDYIACGDTSIAAPTKSVQDKVNELSAVASSAKKTGFELQFEACKILIRYY